MNPELRDRSLLVALLLVAWASLVYAKTVLNASVLPDLNAIIAQVQVLMGGVVGYHVGTGAGQPGAAVAPSSTAPPAAQAGFASVRLLIVLASIALGLSLAGCASLTDAGHAGYSVEPTAGGCKFFATDGKEFSSRALAMTSSTEGCQLMVNEGASSAFQGQAIAGKALSVLPSFAAPILSPGPAVLVPQLMQPAAPPAAAVAPGKAS
jgi:hypothetical protein